MESTLSDHLDIEFYLYDHLFRKVPQEVHIDLFPSYIQLFDLTCPLSRPPTVFPKCLYAELENQVDHPAICSKHGLNAKFAGAFGKLMIAFPRKTESQLLHVLMVSLS